MPYDMTTMATTSEHARRNREANGITDVEIANRLRRKGYKNPDRAIRKYLGSRRWRWIPRALEAAIVELIEEQDAALSTRRN